MSFETQKSQSNLPLEALEKLGFSEKEMATMPPQFLDALKKGNITPLIQTSIVASNGKTVLLPLRMQVLRDAATGDCKLLVYPTRREIDNRLRLSEYELEKVNTGETVTKELQVNGIRSPHLIQYDGRTNSLVHAPVNDLRIDERIKELESIHDIHLGSQQKEQIRNGRPVELNVGNEKVTVGVDLREPHIFTVIKGDMGEWKRREMERYDIAHPEVMGFVKTDRNRWEYQQVVKAQGTSSHREEAKESLSNKTGMKF